MLEDLIHTTLCGIPLLASTMAVYNNKPAVFCNAAPDESDPNWKTDQYPRIVYFINKKYNAERVSNGLLVINILCNKNDMQKDEELLNCLIQNLSELFLTSQGTTTCSLWNREDRFKQMYMGSFDQPYTNITSGTETADIICRTIAFDLVEFPAQSLTSPDPIDSLNNWTKQQFSQCIVIGRDVLSDTWQPKDTTPGIYWRLQKTVLDEKSTYCVSWIKASLICHVIAKEPAVQLKWIHEIVTRLSLEGEVLLSDSSPMLISDISFGSQNNSVKEGEIFLTGKYGILRKQTIGSKLQSIKNSLEVSN